MGAKQSKRSVDISGKEAEGAGEVAAAGAGGEGRVEQLADADSLKPQINGDAHIHEQTDKEKQLDSGTPENEKDATTEKEGKEQEKEESPVTNGESEQKVENGESTPTPEDSKKPKKEKVKKKWSLRSISFSRKDKPKQEKKQKEEEPKTNGETEKVPEEAAESPAEPPVNEVAEEAKPQIEDKEEKTPETPVTEPITNGSSTPESPKGEIALIDEPVTVNQENNRPETKADTEPEQLPINGLSLEEPKIETPEVEQSEVRKLEESITETAEVVAAPEISVKKEVCVQQMPLIEPSPPPLPANPPPSSVASFAATTMAPELTDASLANTAENADLAQPIVPDTKDNVNEISPEPQITLTNTETISTELPPPFKETSDENPVDIGEAETTNKVIVTDLTLEIPKIEAVLNEVEVKSEDIGEQTMIPNSEVEVEESPEPSIGESQAIDDLPPPPPPACDNISVKNEVTESNDLQNDVVHAKEIIVNSNHISDNVEINGFDNPILDDNVATDQENIKNKTKDSLGNVIEDAECNGNIVEQNPITKEEIIIETTPSVITTGEVNEESGKAVTTPDDSMPPSLSEAGASNDASESFPLPPSELCRSECEPSPPASPEPEPAATPQDSIPVCDKMADIVSEVVANPELKTEMLQETTSDVPVAN